MLKSSSQLIAMINFTNPIFGDFSGVGLAISRGIEIL